MNWFSFVFNSNDTIDFCFPNVGHVNSLFFLSFPSNVSVFLKALQKCRTNSIELGPLIKRSQPKLRMYVIYCQNKPISEHIVAEHLGYFEEIRAKLKHKLVVSIRHGFGIYFFLSRLFYHLNSTYSILIATLTQLCDLLIKPIQRIMKYELLLRDIYKHTERAGLVQELPNLQDAIYVMKVCNAQSSVKVCAIFYSCVAVYSFYY